MNVMNVISLLKKKREEGLEAYQALEALKREVLKKHLPPTRYEVSTDPYGGARLVAVLEKDGVEVDRVALKRGYYSLEGEVYPDLHEVARRLNALPPEERPPVGFYPYGEEETEAIMSAISEEMEVDYEDYRGHPLGSLLGVAWRD